MHHNNNYPINQSKMAGPVRQPIDIPSLETYLRREVPEIQLPVDLKQFTHGQSNPTYLLTTPQGAHYVLRKQPPGALLARSAHNVAREHRILSALYKSPVPVPRALALCPDPAPLGSAFYLMAFLPGRIFADPALPGAAPPTRSRMWHAAIRTLAALHRVVPADVGLAALGRPVGFYARQMETFRALNRSQGAVRDGVSGECVGSVPRFEALLGFFQASLVGERSALIHGDYKIDNLVFDKGGTGVVGVLDWEMATVGHPLSDLVNLLTPFFAPASWTAAKLDALNRLNPNLAHPAFRPGSAAAEGLPSLGECVAWYKEAAGWDPAGDVVWGAAFSMLRNALVMQGIRARYVLRQASSARAREVGGLMGPLAEMSWALVEELRRGGQQRGKL
ncbi:MAG: hypothetical protein M1829_005218 [Trizodia sp. TS-e1964]|nr:MAG: hypothetical protein M1829_005218 [Trizodia sp. TS-e1964]